MIHYGCQFCRLIEEAATRAASEAGALYDAKRREDELADKLGEASRATVKAQVDYDRATRELNEALKLGPFHAVEPFRKFNGRYPIS